MKKYYYDMLCGLLVGVFAYIVTLIIIILSNINLREIIYIILYMVLISVFVSSIFFAIINKKASLLHMTFRFFIIIVSYIAIMGINGNIGTIQYIYNMFNIDMAVDYGSEMIVLAIITTVGLVVITFASMGKLIMRILS